MGPPLQPQKGLVAVIDGLDSASSITVPGMPDVFDGKQFFSVISNYQYVGRITSTGSDNKITPSINSIIIYHRECIGNGRQVV